MPPFVPATRFARSCVKTSALTKPNFEQDPELALKVLASVGARLRRLVGIIEELSFQTVRRRGRGFTCWLICQRLPGCCWEAAQRC